MNILLVSIWVFLGIDCQEIPGITTNGLLSRLATKTQSLDNNSIAINVFTFEII
jgi:hypothetical protein